MINRRSSESQERRIEQWGSISAEMFIVRGNQIGDKSFCHAGISHHRRNWRRLTGKIRFLPPLLLEEGLQRVFGILCPVHPSFGRILGHIVITEIGPLFVHNALSDNFLAFIVGIGLVEIALLTTLKVSIAMRTSIASDYFVRNTDLFSTKCTLHYLSPPIMA